VAKTLSVSPVTKNNIEIVRLKMKSRKRKPSATQLRVLSLVKEGRPYHLEAGERHESRTLTLKSLHRRGWIEPGAARYQWEITDAGLKWVPVRAPEDPPTNVHEPVGEPS
jgi:hypothetical protein